ncbi:MAG: sulfurtransferase complex subunit TusB [Leptothrix ochracea]|uniref:sulfurtransferase complex subunit TusB n=1 Tax=Leptothrix ochracea TaxID=735331 RepID=UPI0034E2BEA8
MLHIINKSPLERTALASCLRTVSEGAILLIEDAVYAATQGHAASAQIVAALGCMKVYVLRPDLEARGVGDRLLEGVEGVDYGGFVDLVAEHPNCQSWL